MLAMDVVPSSILSSWELEYWIAVEHQRCACWVTRLLWFGLYKELHCVICRGKAEGIANKVQATLKVFLYVLYVLCAQNRNMNWWL